MGSYHLIGRIYISYINLCLAIGLSEVTKEVNPHEEEKTVKVGMMIKSQKGSLRKSGYQSRRKTGQIWCLKGKRRKCFQKKVIAQM